MMKTKQEARQPSNTPTTLRISLAVADVTQDLEVPIIQRIPLNKVSQSKDSRKHTRVSETDNRTIW